jgi:hypothetical protein
MGTKTLSTKRSKQWLLILMVCRSLTSTVLILTMECVWYFRLEIMKVRIANARLGSANELIGGDVVFYELGYRIELRSGDAIFFKSKQLLHGNTSLKNALDQQFSLTFFTKKRDFHVEEPDLTI